MPHITTIAALLKTVTLVLGGLITFFAYKAYRRTDIRALGALTVGFAVVTLGVLFAGVVDQFLAVNRSWALVVESSLTAIGFGIILYSLYTN